MADSVNRFFFLNPWLLQLQKMSLELKCSLCLNLLNKPLLMPCDHIFCSSCILRSTEVGSKCPVCISPFVEKDLRPAPHMENMVNIYRSMDSDFGSNFVHWVPQSQFDPFDVERASDRFPITISTVIDGRSRKELVDTMRTGISGNPKSSMASLRVNDGAQVPLQHSKVKVEKFTIPDESHVPSNGVAQEKLEQTVGERRVPCGEGSAMSSQTQKLRDERREVGGAPEGLNQFTQTSPDSPPSFGDGKDSEDDSSSHGRQHSAGKFSAKSMLNEESVDGFVTEMGRGPSTQPGEDHGRESKRMKSNYEPRDTATENGIQKSPVSGYESVVKSKSKPKNCFSATVQPSVGADCSDSKSTIICVFCETSSLSQYTGPMMHFANGKEVVAAKAAQPNVLHVHRKCLEWAPQVYFVDDTVYNLEKEISRGAKLKCSHCGLKGATLGCYAKNCQKSFHVPCAVKIEDCRWDIKNFHVLCPTHSSKKFPNDTSKLRKRKGACHASTNHMDSSQCIKSREISATNPQGRVLCGSSLSDLEMNLLAEFAKLTGATISKVWKPNVTHVIAATDDMGACSRTVKVLMAILHGRWVLKIDWIKACLEALQPLSEEPYEVQRDIYDSCDGPKNGRLRILEKAPQLLTGLNFYFFGDFVPSKKECLEDLVLAAGGTLLENKCMLLPQDSKQATSSTFVVYNRDLPQNCTSVGENIYCRFKEAEDFAAEFGCRVIGHTWLLESIAACKIQPHTC